MTSLQSWQNSIETSRQETTFPGNIHKLENILERTVANKPGISFKTLRYKLEKPGLE